MQGVLQIDADRVCNLLKKTQVAIANLGNINNADYLTEGRLES